MTDEELDEARASEAVERCEPGEFETHGAALIAARLAREGWMPVDPDLNEALKIYGNQIKMVAHADLSVELQREVIRLLTIAVKRGRELERSGK